MEKIISYVYNFIPFSLYLCISIPSLSLSICIKAPSLYLHISLTTLRPVADEYLLISWLITEETDAKSNLYMASVTAKLALCNAHLMLHGWWC